MSMTSKPSSENITLLVPAILKEAPESVWNMNRLIALSEDFFSKSKNYSFPLFAFILYVTAMMFQFVSRSI